MPLAALTLLLLTAEPASAWPRRIEVCGPVIASRAPQLRILPRAPVAFSDFSAAPAAFDEPRARPRSSAAFATASPALFTEAPPDRVVVFRRDERPSTKPPRPFMHPHRRSRAARPF